MTSQSITRPQIGIGKVVIATLAAIAAAIAANLIARVLLFALFDLPAGFQPLQAGAIIFFTTIGVLGAGVAYAIVTRVSRTPVRTYWIVATVAFVLSIIPNVMLALNPAAAPMPGGTPGAFAALIVFHVVAFLVSVLVLTRLARPA